nr:uncharacterized protein LOC102446578 [Pelodiscus sinensis]|eukprot:XP_006118056.2 uncharacterized protein LOC102446578 [Pelodiscus sinensis]
MLWDLWQGLKAVAVLVVVALSLFGHHSLCPSAFGDFCLLLAVLWSQGWPCACSGSTRPFWSACSCCSMLPRYSCMSSTLSCLDSLYLDAAALLWHPYPTVGRQYWRLDASSEWWDWLILEQWDNQQRLQNFWMRKQTFLDLCAWLAPVLRRCNTHPVYKRVAITLWKLAAPDSYCLVAHQFRVGRSTVGASLMQVVRAINNILLKRVICLRDVDATVAGFPALGVHQLWGSRGWDPHPHTGTGASSGPLYQPQSVLLDDAPGPHGPLRPLHRHMWGGRAGHLHPPKLQPVSQDGGGHFLPPAGIDGWGHPHATVHCGGRSLHPDAMADVAIYQTHGPQLRKIQPAPELGPQPGGAAFGWLKARFHCLLTSLNMGEQNIEVVAACCVLHNIMEQKGEAFLPGWMAGEGRAFEQPQTAASWQAHHNRVRIREALREMFSQAPH